MDEPRARVLIAAPPAVSDQLGRAFPHGELEILPAGELDEALRMYALRPQLVVVCYVFDEARPYRLLHRILDGERRRPRIMLVRALPIPLGAQEADIRDSYARLGVDEFLNFSDYARRQGLDAALQNFRDAALRHLRRASASVKPETPLRPLMPR